jgi:glutamate synthase (NADPH/NADH) small chain
VETGKRVAVIGSGPAGLAAAQQLRRAGHAVTVFERSDRAGGLLRYGIPDFKLEKRFLERRLQQLETEGIRFELSVDVGTDVSAAYFLKKFAAVALCIGSGVPRDLNIPGRNSAGIHFALDYLIQSNRRQAGLPIATDQEISAAGKRVVVIGGGDTGADCLGTALRQGATGVEQLEVLPRPPEGQNPDTPWPKWPAILRNGSSHEEGGQRWWSIETTAFLSAQGRVAGLRCRRLNWSKEAKTGRLKPTPAGEDFELGADLVLLAMGFVHPQREGLLNGLGVVCDARGNVKTDETMMTAVPGVFAAGDAQTGAWLVAGAIAGGRRMARQMDLFLMGESALLDCPAPPNL